MRTCVQCEDVTNKRLGFAWSLRAVSRSAREISRRRTLSGHHVGDLDNRVDVGFRKDTFSASALDIEAKDSKGRNLRPISFWCMRDEGMVPVREI